MPAVRRLILNMTGIEPMQGAIDPDEAVALGAAVQAAILQGDISNVMVMDQWQVGQQSFVVAWLQWLLLACDAWRCPVKWYVALPLCRGSIRVESRCCIPAT